MSNPWLDNLRRQGPPIPGPGERWSDTDLIRFYVERAHEALASWKEERARFEAEGASRAVFLIDEAVEAETAKLARAEASLEAALSETLPAGGESHVATESRSPSNVARASAHETDSGRNVQERQVP